MIKYFSMFAGIGGFEYGMEKSKHDFECVGYSEVDKYAISIYSRQFQGHRNYGDATKIKTRELPDFDFLVGGFPCQAFSLAGKRRGFDDTRGTLFFEIARVLRDKKPRYFLLENVKGLLSHDKGKTFQKILEILNELGYNVSWNIYNSKNYGVPQNRERVFIKGYLRGKCGREILHQTRNSKEVNGKLIKLNNKAQAQTIYDINGLATCLSANGGGQGGKTGLYKIDRIGNVSPTGHYKGDVLSTKGISKTLCASDYKNPVKIAQPVLMKEDGEPSFTLTATDKHGVYDGYRIRKLTPRECERLQAFPDNWTKYGMNGELISDTQRYKCCGNAVTTNVITAIVDEMFENYMG